MENEIKEGSKWVGKTNGSLLEVERVKGNTVFGFEDGKHVDCSIDKLKLYYKPYLKVEAGVMTEAIKKAAKTAWVLYYVFNTSSVLENRTSK